MRRALRCGGTPRPTPRPPWPRAHLPGGAGGCGGACRGAIGEEGGGASTFTGVLVPRVQGAERTLGGAGGAPGRIPLSQLRPRGPPTLALQLGDSLQSSQGCRAGEQRMPADQTWGRKAFQDHEAGGRAGAAATAGRSRQPVRCPLPGRPLTAPCWRAQSPAPRHSCSSAGLWAWGHPQTHDPRARRTARTPPGGRQGRSGRGWVPLATAAGKRRPPAAAQRQRGGGRGTAAAGRGQAARGRTPVRGIKAMLRSSLSTTAPGST